ncbi:hypothetical protein FQN57_005446 [Myotisia sp. PD_48]|nr:hypothetical protein FQN57_005446 [Myotisia sp. PD_48]
MHLYSTLFTLVAASRLAFGQINPEDIPEATRQQWCLSQRESCPLLCLQMPGTTDQPVENICEEDTLRFWCVCSNGLSPNATEYSQTIPYFICTETNNKCVENCGPTAHKCQSDCRQNNPCGAQNPTPPNSTTTATGTASKTADASSTSATDAVFTGMGEGSAASGEPDKKGFASKQAVLDVGQLYGMIAVLAGVFAGFFTLL